MESVTWSPADSHFALALTWCVLGYGLYWLLSRNGKLSERIWKPNPGSDRQVKKVVLQRMTGFLLLGVLSLLLILLVMGRQPSEFGWGFQWKDYPPWWTLLLVPMVLVASYLHAPNWKNLTLYPQIRVSQWTPRLLMLSSVSWVVFLMGYEFLFRGLLLFSSLEVMAPWLAIVLNCILYSAAHLHKGIEETIGAIPVGVLFCYLTIVTGNIWSVVVLHSIMALSNEWFSIMKNPDLVVQR